MTTSSKISLKSLSTFLGLVLTFSFAFNVLGMEQEGETGGEREKSSIRAVVDGTARGDVIGNKFSTVNLWQYQSWSPSAKDEGANLSEFVESVQFMQATGGNASRDLFLDPGNTDVQDDYDFSSLIEACDTVLKLGAKPHIKFSVPDKFSKDSVVDCFGVDVLPPDDYEAYYRYVRAIVLALIDKFSLEEVQTWGFGVLVEFENLNWFHDKDTSPEGSREAFFKLYDYTVASLCELLGDDVWIGAHAMACTEGLWDERELLNHCATGKNAKTGESPIPIKYFAVSFYDDAPNSPHPMTLAETVNRIRERANELGLTNLRYGVDEGRILGSRKGKFKTDLTFRVVGHTYQSAYDARLFKIMIDNDIDYFSSWTYSSSSPWNGYPLISFRLAQNASKFKNCRSLAVHTDKRLKDDADCDVVAGLDEPNQTLRLMCYNFKFDLDYSQSLDTTLEVDVPFWRGRNVQVTTTIIDDEENFFTEWLKDKEQLSIPDEAFSWSPDSGNLDVGWIDPDSREKYFTLLRDKYATMANKAPRHTVDTVMVSEEGKLVFNGELGPHGVAFYTIQVVDENK